MTLQEDIQKKQQEIAELQEQRPGTKQEYLSSLDILQGQLSDLNAQKEEEDKRVAEEARISMENSAEYKTARLDEQYLSKFTELKDAYLAALVLGDNTAIASNRVAYQALLDEYNLKLEAIG